MVSRSPVPAGAQTARALRCEGETRAVRPTSDAHGKRVRFGRRAQPASEALQRASEPALTTHTVCPAHRGHRYPGCTVSHATQKRRWQRQRQTNKYRAYSIMIARTPEHVSEKISGPAGEGFPQLLSPRRGPGGLGAQARAGGDMGRRRRRMEGIGRWDGKLAVRTCTSEDLDG